MDIDKLGRYDIVRVLGRGAMGVVFEGRDPYLDRQVAIKTIRVQSVSAEAAAEFSGRFRTEARSAARLQHPNIVSVFDSGQDGETSYLVMEFIQGDDLKRHLERGTHFSPRASMKMIYDLLMALDHAHRQNVVHRDVKPANVLIEAGGKVKLADFGVARIQEPDEGNLTQLGTASVGTPRYMSPEQAQGLRVDARSDVFSAGVVLYELLTGKRPFEGENQFIVVNQIVSHAHPPPSRLNPDLPPAIDAVMDKALAKLPDNRYASARDFALALRAVALQLPESADDSTNGFALGADSNPGGSAGSRNAISNAGRPAGAGSSAGAASATESNASISMSEATLAHKVNQEIELEYWKDIKDSTESQDFSGFLGRFPNGIYADRARRRLERFNSPSSGDNTGSGSTGSSITGIVPSPLHPVAPVATPVAGAGVGASTPAPAPTPAATTTVTMPSAEAAAARTPAPAAAPAKVSATPDRLPAKHGDVPAAPAPSRKVWYIGVAALVVIGSVIAVALMMPGGSGDKQAAAPMVAAGAAAAASAAASLAAAQQAASEAPALAGSSAPGSSVSASDAAAVGPLAPLGPASGTNGRLPASAALAASVPAARASARAPQRSGSSPADSRAAASAAGHAAAAAAAHASAAALAASARDHARAPASVGSVAAPLPGVAPGSGGVGPSSPGQACADRVFVFRLSCVAQQCNTDTYRNSDECVQFRDAAKRREVNRPDA